MSGNEAGSIAQSKTWRIRLVGALLITESLGFGCGGLLALMYAVVILVVAVTTGLQYLVLAIAASVVSAALVGLAVALWLLARKLRSRLNRWTLIVLAIEVVLAPMGCVLFGLESQAQPTDNPFAEGGDGYLGLLGFVLAACGTVALLILIWNSATSLRTRRAVEPTRGPTV